MAAIDNLVQILLDFKCTQLLNQFHDLDDLEWNDSSVILTLPQNMCPQLFKCFLHIYSVL